MIKKSKVITKCMAALDYVPDIIENPINLEQLRHTLERGFGVNCYIIIHHIDFEKLTALGCPDTVEDFANKYKVRINVAYGYASVRPGYPQIDVLPGSEFRNETSTGINP